MSRSRYPCSIVHSSLLFFFLAEKKSRNLVAEHKQNPHLLFTRQWPNMSNAASWRLPLTQTNTKSYKSVSALHTHCSINIHQPQNSLDKTDMADSNFLFCYLPHSELIEGLTRAKGKKKNPVWYEQLKERLWSYILSHKEIQHERDPVETIRDGQNKLKRYYY